MALTLEIQQEAHLLHLVLPLEEPPRQQVLLRQPTCLVAARLAQLQTQILRQLDSQVLVRPKLWLPINPLVPV